MKLKAVSLILVLSLVILSACSSGDKKENQQDEISNNITSEITEGNEETATTIERPVIPEGTDYGGYNFRILASHFGGSASNESAYYYEVWAEEEIGEPLNDAVYKRNKIVEDLLNITITPVEPSGSIATFVKKSVNAGSNDFDAISVPDYDQAALTPTGCLANLWNIPQLNLEKSWWDQQAVHDLTYRNNKLYSVSGDIDWYDDYAIMVLMFNKRLLQERGMDLPYQTVREGKWTLDVFSSLVKDFTQDLNGDGKLNQEDQWGMLENTSVVYHFLIGCNETIASVDSDGIPAINALTERHIEAVNKLTEVFLNKDQVLLAGGGQMSGVSNEYDDGTFVVFRSGRGLMLAEMIGVIPKFRDMEDDFGLLPQPKLDENQENYAHFISSGWASSFSIPTTANLELSGTVLETMAGYSTDTVKAALIDVSLKSKFARDAESEEMLELIFATKKYDLCERYQWGSLFSVYCNPNTPSGKFTSIVEKSVASSQKEMLKITDKLDELE